MGYFSDKLKEKTGIKTEPKKRKKYVKLDDDILPEIAFRVKKEPKKKQGKQKVKTFNLFESEYEKYYYECGSKEKPHFMTFAEWRHRQAHKGLSNA